METDVANNRYTQQILRLSQVLELGEPRVSGNDLNMLCPFHKESNPSFNMHTETGEYHCFACGAKGHISHFLENLRCNILTERTNNIEKFEVTSKIDTVVYSAKPPKDSNEVAYIRNRLDNIPMTKYTIKQLLGQLTTGHTVSLSGARKAEQWQGQQVVMIDIDNDYAMTFKELIDFAKEVGFEPTFAYQTYSSTETICRCRFAYVFKNVITDKQVYLGIVNMLIKKFSTYGADKQCADFCRLFYGTLNKDVHISNFIYSMNRFTSEQLNEVNKILGKGHNFKSETSKKSDVENLEETDIEFFNGKYFLHHVFGQYMIDNYNIIRLNSNQLHFYKNGIYENNSVTHDIETEMSTLIPKLNNRNIEEAMGYLARMSKREVESGFEFIAFNNGVLNIVTLNFMEFTPDIIITSRVNADYVEHDESSSNPVVDKFFSDITCGDKDKEILLYEVLGYCCCRTNMYHLSFILKGSGGNGKSTYFKIIKSLLGDSVASIRLKKVTTDKFASTSLYGKTCAIADDINNGKDVDTGLLKTLISGDGIRAEFKFENEFEFEPFATILIGMNNIVTFNDSSDRFR